jgi:hypothetical protein
MKCNGCRFFEPVPDYFDEDGDMSDELAGEKEEYGFCRRHAPNPCQFDPAKALEVSWPLVGNWHWCGEWKPIETEATDGPHPQH